MPSPTKAPAQGVGVAVEEPAMTMDFGTAMKAAVTGSQIRRLAWPNPNDPATPWVRAATLLIKEDRLSIWKEDGSVMDLIVTVGDITAEDWVIVS